MPETKNQPGADRCVAESQCASERVLPKWPLRLAILCGSITVVAYLLVTAGYLMIGLALKPTPQQDSELASALASRAPWEPTNILLVGVDRDKKGTRRADTMILLRVDTFRRRVWLLSIPRDANIGLDARARSAAPACRAALEQATLKSPIRSRVSDGIVSSRAHDIASPLSDHRWGNAFDLTNDPRHGVDCAVIAESLRRSRDPRVKLVIFDGQYFTPREGWKWRTYSGSDPHDKHMHVSVTETERDNASPWPGIMFSVDPKPLADFIIAAYAADSSTTMTLTPEMIRLIGQGRVKANKAYSVGGPAGAITAAERLLDMPIHHYAEIDFQGLTDVVDALGGITIDVPSSINDRVAADASPNNRARRITAGEQVLDGEHALTFVRSRHYWDADFGRVRNQQSFIKATAARVLSPIGLLRLPSVAKAVGDHATSDIDARELVRLSLAIALTAPDHRSAATLVGLWQSPVVQTDPTRRLELVRRMSDGRDFLPMPSEVTVVVLNGSGRTGVGRKVAFELAAQGFPVVDVTNAKSSGYRDTLIVTRKQDRSAGKLVGETLTSARLVNETEERFKSRILVIVGEE